MKFWENGTRPLEIVTSNQWFIRYPPREEMLRRGEELRWWPEFMRVRYENWVNGLIGDWNITRQRFFGVPFPVWYPIDDDGVVQLGAADRGRARCAAGRPVDRRAARLHRGAAGQASAASPATPTSWTPGPRRRSALRSCRGWVDDPDLFARVFPMDLRPQAHDIIRTWLFYTVVRAHYEHDSLPWSNAAISGFVIDRDRKKLSKSAGNEQDAPMTLIGEFGADAVRYWAANGRPGTDLAFDRNQFKIGRRLAIKLLNASRFALGLGDPGRRRGRRPPARPVDAGPAGRGGRPRRRPPSSSTTTAGRSNAPRRFFWSFCDDHLELVKGRAYGGQGPEAQASAQAALRIALHVQLRLFAPFLPFVTEEVWSWWREGSVHLTPWPAADELATDADPRIGEVAGAILSDVRRAKTAAKKSLRADVSRLVVRGPSDVLAALAAVGDDLAEAGRVAELVTEEADELAVEVTLAD